MQVGYGRKKFVRYEEGAKLYSMGLRFECDGSESGFEPDSRW